MIPPWLPGVFLLCFLLSSTAHAQFMPRPTVIENVRIHAADGEIIEGGTIVIRGGRISAIGADFESPGRAVRIDGAGFHATPGLIDMLSGLAMPARASGGNNPAASAHDAFDRYDSRAIEEVVTHGITTIYVSPTAHRGFGPAGSVIRLRSDDNGAFGEVLKPRVALTLNMRSGDDPIDRLRVVDSVRSQLRDAHEYEEAIEIYEADLEEYLEELRKQREAEEAEESEADDTSDTGAQSHRRGHRQADEEPADDDDEEEEAPEKPTRPTPDPQKDVLVEALNHELTVRVYADRAEDIINALEIADEFGLKIVLEGGAESHLVAKQIAAADVPLILTSTSRPTTDLPRRGTQLRRSRDTVASLEAAGVQWALGSGTGAGSKTRFLLFTAQMIMQQSHVEIDPVELVTHRAAKMLGVDDRLGRLAEGMQADIVLWSGDPGDPNSRVQRVFIAGRTVYQRTEGNS